MSLKIDVQNMFVDINGQEREVVHEAASNFSSMMLRIYIKSDPINRAKIKALWPNLVAVYESWKNSPSPITKNQPDHILDLPYDGPMDRPPTNWKLFPIQHDDLGPTFHIPWDVAKLAYEEYHHLFPNEQTLEIIAQRGGFSWGELVLFLSPKIANLKARFIQ